MLPVAHRAGTAGVSLAVRVQCLRWVRPALGGTRRAACRGGVPVGRPRPAVGVQHRRRRGMLRPRIAMRCRRSDRGMRDQLDGTGQHAGVGCGDAAQPGRHDDHRRRQPDAVTDGPPGRAPPRAPGTGPGRPPGPVPRGLRRHRRDTGRGGESECSSRCRLPGQLTRFSRAGQGGEHPGQVMHLRRGTGGDGAPAEDHVQQRLVVFAAGPAGEGEPRHLTMQSVRPAHCVTPARSTRPASRRRARCAATRTAPGDLPTIRATSAASRPATTRSMMISA
jgi:hypothetical protein